MRRAPIPPAMDPRIWEFDTNRRFETLNGVRAGGGAIQGPGPTIVDGVILIPATAIISAPRQRAARVRGRS